MWSRNWGSAGEVNPSSKCADMAELWDDSGYDRVKSMTVDPCMQDEVRDGATCGENLGKPT